MRTKAVGFPLLDHDLRSTYVVCVITAIVGLLWLKPKKIPEVQERTWLRSHGVLGPMAPIRRHTASDRAFPFGPTARAEGEISERTVDPEYGVREYGGHVSAVQMYVRVQSTFTVSKKPPNS